MNNSEKAKEIANKNNILGRYTMDEIEKSCLEMARWKDEQLGWHDAKKEQPPMDEEVIVLTNILNGKELSTPRMICFGHIVDKNYKPIIVTDICRARFIKGSTPSYDKYVICARGICYRDYYTEEGFESFSFEEACEADQIEFIEPDKEDKK